MSERLWTRDNLANWMFKVYDSVSEEEAKEYLGLDKDEDITEAIPEKYLDNCAYFLIAKDWAYDSLANNGYDFVWFMADGDHYLGQTIGDRMYDVTDEVIDCVYRAVDDGKFTKEYLKGIKEDLNDGEDEDDWDRPYKKIVVEYICPLTISAMDVGYYDDYEEPYQISSSRATDYSYSIRRALQKEHSYDGCDPQSMASYQDNPKVEWVRFDVANIDGKLWGVIRVGLKEELDVEEEKEFKDWIEGQCSDGFGEGFEQTDIKVDGGDRVLNVSFWNYDDSWSLKRRDRVNESCKGKKCKKDKKLNEKMWTYTCKSGKELRDAISDCDEDDEEGRLKVLRVLRKCYEELLEKNIIDEDEFDMWVTADLDDIIEDAESGWVDEDDIDYQLSEFYDLCDNRDVWVQL